MPEPVGYLLHGHTYHLMARGRRAVCGREVFSTTTREEAEGRGLRLCSFCRAAEQYKSGD